MAARREDDYCCLAWASDGVLVEVLVQLAPPLPEPVALLSMRGPAEHLALLPPWELDDCVRVGTITLVVPDVPGALTIDLRADDVTNRYRAEIVDRVSGS